MRDRRIQHLTRHQVTGLVRLDTRRVPLDLAFGGWLLAKEAERVSESTLRNYRAFVGPFIEWAEQQGLRYVDQVDANVVRAWSLELQSRRRRAGSRAAAKPPSMETVRTELRHLRVFTRWCESEDYLEKCPFRKVKLPRAPRLKPTTLSDADLAKLLRSVRKQRENRLRDEAILLVLVDTGLRVSELCGLDLDDWEPGRTWKGRNLGVGRLRILGKGAKERILSLTPVSEAALRAYVELERAPGAGPLFRPTKNGRSKERMGRHAVELLLNRLEQRTGVASTPHMFRRTFALNYARRHAGDLAGLCALMGWESFEVSKHYFRLVAEDRAVEQRRDSISARLRAVR